VKEYSTILEVTGEATLAADIYTKVFGDNPTDQNQQLKVAELYAKAGNYDRAEKLLLALTSQRPSGNVPCLTLYSVYEKKNDRKKGIKALRDFLAYRPEDSYVQEALGMALLEDKQSDAAIKELTRAMELEPRLVEKNSNLIASIRKGPAPKQLVIPLQHVGNSYFADVVLNGNVHGKFVVDTGASSVAISQELADKLALTPLSGQPTIVAGATGIAISRNVTLRSVRVGKAEELMVVATILPAKLHIDGLLGMTFLRHYQATLDTKHNALILKRD
jgi:clan AA aspartic protease (TIGR02281 family)